MLEERIRSPHRPSPAGSGEARPTNSQRIDIAYLPTQDPEDDWGTKKTFSPATRLPPQVLFADGDGDFTAANG